jgi:hypothetical protein
MTDDRLGDLLRAAMPPPDDNPASRLDRWPDLVARIERRARWTVFDFGLAAAAACGLLMFPEWLWLLAFHL